MGKVNTVLRLGLAPLYKESETEMMIITAVETFTLDRTRPKARARPGL